MQRSDISDLHYITTISNVLSISKNGIVSHRFAKQFEHVSVAMAEIQDKRKGKVVPGGKPLHDYASLYFTARNPMLYKRKDLHKELCVLRVSTEVLDLRGVVIADGNAASEYTAFWPSPMGLARLNKDLVFAEYWTDEDQIQAWRKKRVKCAEVLVPDRVSPQLIVGAYVSCSDTQNILENVARTNNLHLSITVNAHLFFRWE